MVILRSLFLDATLCPSVFCVLVIYGVIVSEQYVIKFPGLHTSGGILSSPAVFLVLILLSTELSSSCVNCPSLMYSWLLIIFVIGSSVTFSGFPSKFSKCCFHRYIHSFWLVAFSLALTVLFLQLISFTIWQVILDGLSSTVSLNLWIWFCMYSVLLKNIIKKDSRYIFWKNSFDAIEWFRNIKFKSRTSFIQFDIIEFYPLSHFDHGTNCGISPSMS